MPFRDADNTTSRVTRTPIVISSRYLLILRRIFKFCPKNQSASVIRDVGAYWLAQAGVARSFQSSAHLASQLLICRGQIRYMRRLYTYWGAVIEMRFIEIILLVKLCYI